MTKSPTHRGRHKKHKPIAVKIPAIIPLETAGDAMPLLAGRLHAGIITLIERPAVAHCNNLSRQLCIIAGGMSHANNGDPIKGKRDAASLAIQSAINAIDDVIQRHERTGGVAVLDTEALTLRAAAGKLDDALYSMPLLCYRLAEGEVARWVDGLVEAGKLEAVVAQN
jgi:hypothetical protein